MHFMSEMGWKRFAAVSAAVSSALIADASMFYLIGQGKCAIGSWQEEFYLYFFQQNTLQMCLTPSGKFHLGVQNFTADWWMMVFLVMLTLLMVAFPLLFLKFWNKFSSIFNLSKEKKSPIIKNPTEGYDIDIMLNLDDIKKLLGREDVLDIEIVFD